MRSCRISKSLPLPLSLSPSLLSLPPSLPPSLSLPQNGWNDLLYLCNGDITINRQDTDLKSAMSALGTTKSEGDINMLMKQHTLQREECELKWSKELHRLRESQKREYRDWVTKVYEDMESSSQGEKSKLTT